jgi:hypothetical protein
MKLRLALLAVLATLGSVRDGYAQFTAGNIQVLRVGDGSAALGNTGTAVFLDEYFSTLASQTSPNFTVNVTTSNSAARLVNSGSATSEGQITLGASGNFITVVGYDAAVGAAGVAGSTSTTNPRVVNTVDFAGNVTRFASTSTNFSANNIRSGYSNGTNAWAVGANSGTIAFPGDVPVSGTPANQRVVNSFNGNLYTTVSGASTSGIYQVGTGLPTASGTTTSLVFSTVGTGTGTASPYAFAFNPAGNVAYVADDRATTAGGGIQKWTLSSGTWNLTGTFSGLSGTLGARGLAVDFSDPGNPILYATTTQANANQLVRLLDSGTNFSDAFTVLATAPSNTAFRGVVFSPVPEPVTVGLIAAGVLAAGAFVRRKLRPTAV